MEQQANPTESSTMISLLSPIGARDGSMGKDGKMVNCFIEKTVNGNAAVKRPGTSLLQQNPAGKAQGIFNLVYPNAVYSISGDIIYFLGSTISFSIPGVLFSNLQYQFAPGVTSSGIVLKSISGIWTFDGLTVTKVTDVNYPVSTVPGLVVLDGTYYVMDTSGNIRGSALQNPMSWPALNFIGVDPALGQPIAINRHLNYLQAMCINGIQLYYDAGNATGSPLAAVSNASFRMGLAIPESLQELGDQTYFIGKSAMQFGRSLLCFDGLSLSSVSTPEVDRILTSLFPGAFRSFTASVTGHSFYVVTAGASNVTLCYDIGNKTWQVWTSMVNGAENCFVGSNSISSYTDTVLQDDTSGALLKLSLFNYADLSGPINFFIRTAPYDWGTLRVKFIPELHLLADTIATTVSIRYSDDDYQTFSAYRTVSLSTVRKMLQRCGSSRRRSWDILHTAATPLKLYGMEIQPTVGPG